MFHPILASGSIYFYGRNDEEPEGYFVRSLDSSEGTLNWQQMVDGQVRGPGAVYGGSVYFTVNDWVIDGRSEYSYLLSLDATMGVPNWQYRVAEWINTGAVEFGGNIYFGTYASGNDYLYSIDPRTGELSRRYRTVGGSYYTPLIVDGKAYIPSGSGSLHSIDLRTGTMDWEYRPRGGFTTGTPILSDGNIYFRVYDLEAEDYLSVHALDAATGSLKWKYEPGEGLQNPTASKGSIYVQTYTNTISY